MAFRSALLAAASLLVIGTGSTVSAGGPIVVEAPEAAPGAAAASDWSGYYVGVSTAQPQGDTTWDLPRLAFSLTPGEWSGTLPALTLGRDWQRGRLTFGAALSLSNGEISARPVGDPNFSCFECDTVVSDLKTLRGRAGLAAGKMHYFITGGFAEADVAGTSGSGRTTVNSGKLTGWTLGLGLERKLTDNITLSASYDKVDLGSIILDRHVPGTIAEIDFGLMQIGVNYRW